MKVAYKARFEKDILAISNNNILAKLQVAIESVKKSSRLNDIPNLKKIKGTTNAYRIKLGDFRIGLFFVNDTVEFCRCLHRKDIYRYFP